VRLPPRSGRAAEIGGRAARDVKAIPGGYGGFFCGAAGAEGVPNVNDSREERDDFDAVLAELNNVVAGVFGHAHLLALNHRPDLVDRLNRETARYKELVARLRRIHRGEEGE